MVFKTRKVLPEAHLEIRLVIFWLSYTGGREAACPPQRLAPSPEIWSENNKRFSITKEICITIDSPEKIPGRRPVLNRLKIYFMAHHNKHFQDCNKPSLDLLCGGDLSFGQN